MSFKLLPISIVVASMLVSTTTVQAKSSQMLSPIQSPKDVIDYWTPERLKDAIPMDLPRVAKGSLKEASINKNIPVQVVSGSSPIVDIQPDNHQLFVPNIPKSEFNTSLDAGTLGELFTSSRLVPDTADITYPYRTVGKLFFRTASGDNKTCTASVISKRILLTAGHCLHNGNGAQTGWSSNYLFIPAYHNGAAPFQTWAITIGSVQTGWYSGGGTVPNPVDYGVLEVVDQTINGTLQTIGNVTGYLGWASGKAIPNHAHIIGYSNNFDSGNLMHQITAQSAKAVDANNVEYGSDMSVGAGGSPWIQNFGVASTGQTGGTNAARNTVVGTSSYAYNDTVSLSNGGSIFDAQWIGLINFICAHKSGNC